LDEILIPVFKALLIKSNIEDMRNIHYSILVFSILLSNGIIDLYGQEKPLMPEEQPLFNVSKTKNPIIIDGTMTESDWQRTEVRSFKYFYRIDKQTDIQNTNFRMLWDEEKLYFFFECEDKYITSRETVRDGTPYFDDCAEIMLIPVPDSLNLHFCFELNLYKAVNDLIYLNNFYEGNSGYIKAYNPDYEAEVNIIGTMNDNSDIDKGWSMELAIPFKAFNNLNELCPVRTGTQWAFLAIRQDRNDAEGIRRSTSTLFPIYDIEKTVHQPNRFGFMKFIN